MRVGICCGLALLLLTACESAEAPHSAAEIEAAVEGYLSERTDLRLDRLSVRADRIRYGDDRAVAEVSIVAKDDPKAVMTMMYELERRRDGWRVVPSESSLSGQESSPSAPRVAPSLPPGHPPTEPSGTRLPPGHPPLDGGER